MVERYPGKRTEYGGGDGSPQRLPDGSEKLLTSGEQARILRQMGKVGDLDTSVADGAGLPNGGVVPSGLTESEQAFYAEEARIAASRRAARAKLAQDTNGYGGTATGVGDQSGQVGGEEAS